MRKIKRREMVMKMKYIMMQLRFRHRLWPQYLVLLLVFVLMLAGCGGVAETGIDAETAAFGAAEPGMTEAELISSLGGAEYEAAGNELARRVIVKGQSLYDQPVNVVYYFNDFGGEELLLSEMLFLPQEGCDAAALEDALTKALGEPSKLVYTGGGEETELEEAYRRSEKRVAELTTQQALEEKLAELYPAVETIGQVAALRYNDWLWSLKPESAEAYEKYTDAPDAAAYRLDCTNLVLAQEMGLI